MSCATVGDSLEIPPFRKMNLSGAAGLVQEKSEGKKKKKNLPIPEALRKIKATIADLSSEDPKFGCIFEEINCTISAVFETF